MDDRENLTIIDGKSVFYRGYYAMGHLSLPDGTPTGGVYGFATMLIEIIEKLQPEYIAVAWDKSKTNIRRRRAIYADYKANRKPAAPSYSTSYSLDGEFVKNEASKSMVARVNAVRTEIDRILRIGGFICFGEKYSRISGDSNSALALLEKLPGLMRSSATLSDFKSAVRAAGLVYLPEVICEEIYRNRIDYPKLQERYEKIKGDMEIQRMINEAAQPLL